MNILLARHAAYSQTLRAAKVRRDYHPASASLSEYVAHKAAPLPVLPATGWAILTPAELALKAKMEAAGPRLADWPIIINYGVKTGYNQAFIIDGATRARLIAEDPKSAEVIKPTLRGRDLRRYHATFADQWMIFARRGFPIKRYPAIEKHLRNFKQELTPRTKGATVGRKPGNYQWFELQDQVNYFADFEKPKIVWGELSDVAKFTYDADGRYLNNTIFMLTGDRLKYLLALLNSRTAQWYFELIATTSGVGTTRWFKYKVEQLPIPQPSPLQEAKVVTLVNDLLYAKSINKEASDVEQNLERITYELYNLSKDDICLVEGNSTA